MKLNLTRKFFFSSSLFRGTALARRLKDREHEIELDHRDRYREKEEIEELRQKLLLQNHIDDVELEIKRRVEKEEEIIRKRLIDLTRISDESDEESNDDDNEQKPKKSSITKTDRKENMDISTDLANSSMKNSSITIEILSIYFVGTDSIDHSSRTTIKVESPQNGLSYILYS